MDHYTPTPYLNPDGSLGRYLRDAASVLQDGERTRLLNFPNIVPQANTPDEIKYAARALYYAAQSWLLQHKDEHYVFTVKAVNVPAGLLVGDKVRVVYRGVVTRPSWYRLERSSGLTSTSYSTSWNVKTRLALPWRRRP